MPFRPMTGRREFQTRDLDHATAVLADHFRAGVVSKLEADAEIGFAGHYFARPDFVVAEITASPGWSFQPTQRLDAVMAWLPLSGESLLEHDDDTRASISDKVLLTSADSTKRVTFENAYHGLVLATCGNVMRAEIEQFIDRKVENRLNFLSALDPESRSSAMLHGFGVALHAGLTGESTLLSSEIGLRRVRDSFINLALTSLGREKLVDMAGQPRSVSSLNLDRAEAFMRAHADQPIGISDVAMHLGVSTRALQYTFRRLRNTTPLAVLTNCRLEGVRRDLTGSKEQRIADVAAKWGFTHLGRFSRQYRMAFGERPSETLSRSKA